MEAGEARVLAPPPNLESRGAEHLKIMLFNPNRAVNNISCIITSNSILSPPCFCHLC